MGVQFYPAGLLTIRDAAWSLLKEHQTDFGWKKVDKARSFPKQDSDLPYASVWLAGDTTEADGDANAGVPSFVHRARLVVDLMVKAESEDALEAEVGTLTELVRATLLTDIGFLSKVEAVERCDTRYDYPKEGTFIMAQGVIEIEVTFRSMWEPTLPDLREVVVTYPQRQAEPILQVTFPE